MRRKIFNSIFFILLLAFASTAYAQDQQDQSDEGITVRGAFLTTRPAPKKQIVETSNNATPTPTPIVKKSGGNKTERPSNSGTVAVKTTHGTKKNPGTTNVARRNPGTNNINVAGGTVQPVVSTNTVNFAPSAIGLGYTLYMRDANGDATRVDPARVFHEGESIRIALEANTDGYLYVFHTENAGKAEMIFPDARLGRGNNFIRAHVPYEVPSNLEADERLRWFVFDATPANEHLYIVVTRQPLPDVPTGESLVSYCQDTNHSCPWNPPANAWSPIKHAQETEQVAVSKIKDEGRALTQGEREAATRGLGLSQDAPPPSVIRMTASSTTGILVTTIDLIHK